jgi:radical SAM protein with 4Fe4S-binding SPASM domain
MSFNLEFNEQQIQYAKKNKKLLSIDLEITDKCNLNCVYCYNGSKLNSHSIQIDLSILKERISQAKAMGVKSVSIVGGGEPFLFSGLFHLIDYIIENNLHCILLTNGTLIDESSAKKLFQKGVDIVLKFNSFSEETQDKLAGSIKGTSKKINKALARLIKAGYTRPNSPMLAIESVICDENYEEIEKLYFWAKDNNIVPYIEIMTEQGNAKKFCQQVPKDKIRKLFARIADEDKKRYSSNWIPRPPLLGMTCRRLFYNAYITCNGEVQPCAGITVSGGNLKRQKLKDIIENSEIFNICRNMNKMIKEPCKSCEYNGDCYGCRGNAYQATGDIFAKDPTCWIK